VIHTAAVPEKGRAQKRKVVRAVTEGVFQLVKALEVVTQRVATGAKLGKTPEE